MPVLVEGRHHLEHAGATDAATRPGARLGHLHVEAAVRAQVDLQPPCGAGERRSRLGAERVSISVTGGVRDGAQEPGRVRGETERGPVHRVVPRRRTVHPVEGDQDPPARGIGEPPVVPLHRHAVRAQQVTERQICASRPVGLQAPTEEGGQLPCRA